MDLMVIVEWCCGGFVSRLSAIRSELAFIAHLTIDSTPPQHVFHPIFMRIHFIQNMIFVIFHYFLYFFPFQIPSVFLVLAIDKSDFCKMKQLSAISRNCRNIYNRETKNTKYKKKTNTKSIYELK